MRVLLDTNVALDFLLHRQPWGAQAALIWAAAKSGDLRCCVTASSITDIFYVCRRLVGFDAARVAVRACFDALEILPVDKAILTSAFLSGRVDFEDAVQLAAAEAHAWTRL